MGTYEIKDAALVEKWAASYGISAHDVKSTRSDRYGCLYRKYLDGVTLLSDKSPCNRPGHDCYSFQSTKDWTLRQFILQ
jgi:hypothetical protein